LALLDRREAFDEDLVIFHRTGATIGRVEEAGAGREGRSVRGDLQVFLLSSSTTDRDQRRRVLSKEESRPRLSVASELGLLEACRGQEKRS